MSRLMYGLIIAGSVVIMLMCRCTSNPTAPIPINKKCQITIHMHSYPWVTANVDTITNDTGFNRNIALTYMAWQATDTTITTKSHFDPCTTVHGTGWGGALWCTPPLITTKSHCWLQVAWLSGTNELVAKAGKIEYIFVTRDTIL